MRCETCRGHGTRLNPALRVRIEVVPDSEPERIEITNPNGLPILLPCPDCGGSGIMSCCDGAVGTEADCGGNR